MKINNSTKLEGMDFIVFGEDYGRHPHTLEHLMNQFLPANRLLWVETIGLRSPTLSLHDIKRSWQVLRKWLPWKKKAAELTDAEVARKTTQGLLIVSPFMLPFNQIPFIRLFNQWSVLKKVRQETSRLHFRRAILITSVPQSCDFVQKLGEVFSIYFCVDEFSLWPGLPYRLVQKLESKLLEKADFIMATSSELVRTKARPGKEVHLFTHGVDLEHFRSPLLLPSEPQGRSLRICYYGLIDQRCDQDLLVKVAQKFPHASITIIGNVIVPHDLLKAQDNIHFMGPVPYQELPKAIRDQDIFILPYFVNELTKNINPLKLKEYMATGRPVVTTALPEAINLQQYLWVGSDHEAFLDHLDLIQQDPASASTKTIAAVAYLQRSETWESKALQLSEIIRNRLGLGPLP